MNSHQPIEVFSGGFAQFLEIMSFASSILSAVWLFPAWSNKPLIELSQYLTSKVLFDQSKGLFSSLIQLHTRDILLCVFQIDQMLNLLEGPNYGSTKSHWPGSQKINFKMFPVIYPQGIVCLGDEFRKLELIALPLTRCFPLVLFLICQSEALMKAFYSPRRPWEN